MRERRLRGRPRRGRRPQGRRVPGHRGPDQRSSARSAASTRRSPRTASSAPRSAWPSTACARCRRSSSRTSSSRPSTRSSARRPSCATARAASTPCPMVIRTPYGGGIRGGLYHSQSGEAYFCHTPGLKVVIPSTPARRQGPPARVDPRPRSGAVPRAQGALPLGQGRGAGRQLHGRPLGHAQRARGRRRDRVLLRRDGPGLREGGRAGQREGHRVPRSSTCARCCRSTRRRVLEATRKTGRVVVVHEAPRFCGFGAEISALIAENVIEYMEAPVRARHRLRHAVPQHARAPLHARPAARARRDRARARVLARIFMSHLLRPRKPLVWTALQHRSRSSTTIQVASGRDRRCALPGSRFRGLATVFMNTPR